MNSKNLKKTYAQAYERFFSENSIVVSSPFIMSWSGDVLNNFSGVSIKQKIPLRMYMGYSKTNSGKLTINNIYYIDFNESKVIKANALEYAPYFNDLMRELEKKYSKLINEYEGIEINIFSELPRSVGLGFGSIVGLLLSVLINRLSGHIDSQKIDNLKIQNINELINDFNDMDSDFCKVFLEALHFDKYMYGMISNGSKLASFFDSYYPIVSFAEDANKSVNDLGNKIKRYYGFRLNDLFKELREIPYGTIDYGLVYSGKPVLLEQIAGSNYKNNSNSTKKIKSDFKKVFSDNLNNLPPIQRPKFYKYLIDTVEDEFELTYGKLMGIISLKILYFMSKVYSEGYDEFNMLQLLDSLRKFRQGDCVTRDSSLNFLRFIRTLLENFTGPAQYISLSPNDTTIMGGSLLFAMPLEGFRKTFLDSVEKTEGQCPGSKLIYANRIDGVEYEGLKFEQDFSNNIFSEFIGKSNCILRKLDGGFVIGDCDKTIEGYKTGVLLDRLNNKIYLNGEKLTSQELHSQSATIEILAILIENIDKDISNKDLPFSSYSKNKNEMLGKIVIPLVDLIEKKTGMKLPLICKGSLHDFYMKLNKSSIDIASIDRL